MPRIRPVRNDDTDRGLYYALLIFPPAPRRVSEEIS